MQRQLTYSNLRKLIVFFLVSVLTFSVVYFFGCTPTAQQTGPQISPERQKQIQDSLKKEYDKKLALHWSTAYEYYKNKMYRNSIKPFWKVVELDTIKRFKNTFTYLSDAYIKLNNADSAEIVLQLGTERFPDNAYLHSNLGYILSSRGMIEEAIAEYEKAVELDSTSARDWKQLANLYVRNNQNEEAIEAFEQVVSLAPNDQDAQRTLSQLYKSFGDADAAIQRMEEVKKLSPENLDNLFNLGREYYNIGNYEKAIENFEALLKIKPDDVSSMMFLGGALQQISKYSQAINIYKKALEIQPENKKVYTDIAESYKELGNFSTARSYANRALQIDSRYGLAFITRGKIYEASAEKCMAESGKDMPDFDDKLVFELAYKEYQKAAQDLQFKDMAESRMNYVIDFTPKQEDIFFHKGKTKPKKDCYNWIY